MTLSLQNNYQVSENSSFVNSLKNEVEDLRKNIKALELEKGLYITFVYKLIGVIFLIKFFQKIG